MTHLDLFSGIGGFALAAQTVWGNEYENVGFCDNDLFCQAILKKHWPNAMIYGDIRSLTNTDKPRRERKDVLQQGRPRIGGSRRVDVLTGGFPCQPFSQAGSRKGTKDDRHLWPEMYRVIQEFSPRYVVAENVRGLLSIDGGLVFEQVCLDLETLGYEVQPFVIPACAVNAPHRRDRVWFIARNTEHDGCNGTKDCKSGGTRSYGDAKGEKKVCEPTRSALSRDVIADTRHGDTRGAKRRRDETGTQDQLTGCFEAWNENWTEVATNLCGVDDGISQRLDRNPRLKALGNAIVPQVAIEIFKTIKLYEQSL